MRTQDILTKHAHATKASFASDASKKRVSVNFIYILIHAFHASNSEVAFLVQ